MIQYSFLVESFNALSKRLSRYTPEERKRIVDKLVKLGKKNGGLYSPEEYGERMLNGQWSRLQNIARKNGRKIKKFVVRNPLESGIVPATHADLLYKSTTDPRKIRNYRNNIRGIDIAELPSQVIGSQSSLEKAHIASHEADEYSLMFRNAKKLGIAPELFDLLNNRHNMTSKGKHHIGVLKRELNRSKKLNSVYGTQFKQRDADEFSHNDIPVKTLLKYLGSIKNKEKLIAGNPTYEKNLEILKKQKETIEEFIRRRNEILKMPSGFVKSLQISALKRDIDRYNYNISPNRKILKLNF